MAGVVFLTYMCVEYVTHLKSKFLEIRDSYRTHLARLLSPYVEKNLSDKHRNGIEGYAESKQAEGYKFKNLRVEWRDSLAGELYLKSMPIFTIGPHHLSPITSEYNFTSTIEYSKIRSYRIRASVRVAATEGIGFEYILPAIYPCAALVLLVYPKFDVILALISTSGSSAPV